MELDTRTESSLGWLCEDSVRRLCAKTLYLHATLGVGPLWDSCTLYTEPLPTTTNDQPIPHTIFTLHTQNNKYLLHPSPRKTLSLYPGHHHSVSTACSTGQCLPLTPPTSPRRPHRPRPTHTHPLHSSRRRHANCQNLPTMDPTIPRWSTLGGEESSSYPIAPRIPSAGPVLWP
jgi:hypothetical protein